MKPRLPRKVTANARINLNRFWNELEEFYNRREEDFSLPAYTTDAHNHDREEAENRENERREAIEAEAEAGLVKEGKLNNGVCCVRGEGNNSSSSIAAVRQRLESYDVAIGSEFSDESDYEDDDSAIDSTEEQEPSSPVTLKFNDLHGMPSPPNTLPKSLVKMVAMLSHKY